MEMTQDVEGAQGLDEDYDDINADVTTEQELWAAETDAAHRESPCVLASS